MPYFTSAGRRLHYRASGEGPLCLVLPGATASSAHHEGDLRRLSQQFGLRAVSLDFAGTGQSGRLDRWPDDWWEQGAHDAAALVAHLGEETALVSGTSGGGVIALLAAILHPERVRAVIADSCIDVWDPDSLRVEMAKRDARTPGQVGFWQHGHGDDWARVVEADSDLIRRFADAGADWFGGRLARIACPVLLTGSLRDDAIPTLGARQQAMALAIPDCQVFLYNRGGHPLMWSEPEAFYGAFAMFLGGLG